MTDGFPSNWQNEVVRFNAGTQGRIGGYPRKAWVRDGETGAVYRSLVNDNLRPLDDPLAWSRVAG